MVAINHKNTQPVPTMNLYADIYTHLVHHIPEGCYCRFRKPLPFQVFLQDLQLSNRALHVLNVFVHSVFGAHLAANAATAGGRSVIPSQGIRP